ncbi:hypothetical protein [Histidinibacterium aquaticum]|uniref:DUF2484 family protein n=1 Tax=Histidinibacterium aquaticum TaxID=2613962 RepID=A0A5J5GIR5_9RHOB|nr:hypothetical protein [Histidinibacterium aquaticum]KAA9007930.1 hypothetical protein F3S47_10445 [Histidinibacterium aquaticum]
MTAGGIALWIAVAVVAASLSRLVARLFWAFALAAGVLLLVHMRADPGEAALGLAALGGGWLAVRPLRRLLTGGLL